MSDLIILPKMSVEAYEGIWIENTNEVYHGDKSHVGSSDLKLIQKSPWSFLEAMKDKYPREESDAFRLGSMFHMAVLEPKRFFTQYVVMPEFIGKTKDGRDSAYSSAAKAKKEEWLKGQPANAVILNEREMIQIEGMVNSVLSHNEACKLLKSGRAEVSGYYRDPVTGINCKFRPDFMNFDLMALIDVKTTQDCTIEAFSKTIGKFKYHFQMAHYCKGVEAIMKKKVAYPVYFVVEKLPPYEVAIYTADEVMLQMGMNEVDDALYKLKTCLELNTWPKYQHGIQMIGLPYWALKGLYE